MPILTLQRQLRELGRIRTGVQVAATNGKKRPSKLETFRFTSESKSLVEAAAHEYGGTVAAWSPPAGGQEWEVISEASAIDIVVPPGQPVSQWYELWSGGGCLRRCNGITNVLDMSPCACPSDVEQRLELAKDGMACKATTRLNVILPALPDLGVWRLESHGYYAAVELAGAAEILAMASATGRLIPARLRLEQREKKIPGQPTNKYAVPIIEFTETRMADLRLSEPNGQAALGPGTRVMAQLPAGETTLPDDPTASEAPGASAPPSPPTDTGTRPPAAARPAAAARSANPRPAAGGPCGNPSPFPDTPACGLKTGHVDAGERIHKAVGEGGEIVATWPAKN